jgi:hypothetical protein
VPRSIYPFLAGLGIDPPRETPQPRFRLIRKPSQPRTVPNRPR